MSELIYYDEVRPLAEIDTTNPLAQYAQVAVLPNQGSGDVLTELVTGATLTSANPITWNADGSVAASTGNILTPSSPLLGATNYNNGDDILLFFDTKKFNAGGQNNTIFKVNLKTYNDYFSITLSNYGNTIYYTFLLQGTYYNRSIAINKYSRYNCVIHFSVSNLAITTYIDGVAQPIVNVATDFSTTRSNILTVIGLPEVAYKSLYGMYYLKGNGSFTTAEIDEIVTNPYQLFKTQQDVQQEYSLVADGINEYVTLDQPSADNTNGGDYEFLLEIEAQRDTENVFLGADNYLSTTGFTTVWGDINPVGLDPTDGFHVYSIYAKYTATGAVKYCELSVDGVTEYTGTFPSSITGRVLPLTLFTKADGGTDNRRGKVKKYRFIDYNNSTNNRYWNFNQTNGSTVTDLYNGAIATLNNFPADSGYIRDASTGLISGYLTDSTTGIEIPTTTWKPNKVRYTYTFIAVTGMTGTFLNPHSYNNSRGYNVDLTKVQLHAGATDYAAQNFYFASSLTVGNQYTITVEAEDDIGKYRVYLDGVQVGTEYQSDYVGIRPKLDYIFLWGYSHTKTPHGKFLSVSLKLEDMTGALTSRNYDFTTGDTESIPDTISGNNATINNVKTSGFMPVLSKQVYNVKVDGTGDYNSFANFVGGVVGSDNTVHYVANIYDFLTEKLTTVGWTNCFLNLTVQAAKGYEFKGNINQGAGFDTSALGTVFFDVRQTASLNYLIKDLRFYDGNTGGWGSSWSVGTLTGSRIQLTNCGFKADPHWKTANSYYFLIKPEFFGKNLLIIDYPRLTYAGKAISIDDCIYVGNGLTTRVIAAGSMITNLVYDNGATAIIDASSVPASTNALVDVNGLNYFTDPANGDYTINTTGQTALAGQGWNGSDIAGWAYVTDIPVSGMDIVAQDISVATNIAGVALTKIANIIASILSTATNIETNPITKTSTLNATSINVATEIASSIITSIKNLTAFDISTSTTINNIVLLTVNSLIAKNIIVGTQLLTGSLNRAASVNTSGINVGTNSSTASTTKVSNILAQSIVTAIEETLGTLHKTTSVSTKDISTGTNIKLASLLRVGSIVTSNIDVLAQTSNVSLTRYGTVIPNSINIATSINGNSISKSANILINEMNIPTNISSINLYTGVIKPIDPTLLTISDSSAGYIISSEITYKVN